MPMDKPVAPRWSYSKDEKWRKRGTAARSPESSLLESKGAHLAETPPNCDVETRTQILGDDRTLRHKYWETEPKSPTLTVPTVIAAHSANLAETPQDVEEQSKPATNPSDGAHHAETPQIIGDTQAATKSKLFTYYGGEKEAASGSGGSCNVQVGETMPFANICDCSEQKAKDETDMDSLQICRFAVYSIVRNLIMQNTEQIVTSAPAPVRNTGKKFNADPRQFVQTLSA